ncbi:MAG TPA: M24 family metallopeptidase, partial [Nakamurella sp.]
MIQVLSPTQVEAARPAGRFVGRTLATLRERVRPGTNLLDIDAWARELIAREGAVSCYVDYAPSFGRGPFGRVICTSVNDAVLHGLPYDHVVRDGDLLTLDFAVSVDGWVADAAVSFVVGERMDPVDQELIDLTRRA